MNKLNEWQPHASRNRDEKAPRSSSSSSTRNQAVGLTRTRKKKKVGETAMLILSYRCNEIKLAFFLFIISRRLCDQNERKHWTNNIHRVVSEYKVIIEPKQNKTKQSTKRRRRRHPICYTAKTTNKTSTNKQPINQQTNFIYCFK